MRKLVVGGECNGLFDFVDHFSIASTLDAFESALPFDALVLLVFLGQGLPSLPSLYSLNTIHTQPSPPYPSHALFMALRVLHLDPKSSKIPNIENGFTTYISPSNELAAISTLENILTRVVRDSDKRLGWLERLDCGPDQDRDGSDSDSDSESEKEKEKQENEKEKERQKEGVVKMLKGMCVEEKILAEKILEKIEAGEDFS